MWQLAAHATIQRHYRLLCRDDGGKLADRIDDVTDRRAEGEVRVAREALLILIRQARDLPKESVDRLKGGARIEAHSEDCTSKSRR